MTTVISGTGRPGSNTKKVALTYCKMLQEAGINYSLLSLDEHNVYKHNEEFIEIEKKYIIPADRFIMIVPEYNGSYPGILKLMLDNSDVTKCWHHKKVLLTGISTGRAGNLRGLDHLTGSLMYLKMHVHPNRLPISVVDKLIGDDNEIHDEPTIHAIRQQLNEFQKF